jgi:hypothetical protein
VKPPYFCRHPQSAPRFNHLAERPHNHMKSRRLSESRRCLSDRVSMNIFVPTRNKAVFDLDEKYHEPLTNALAGEKLVYAVPAIAAEDVPGFKKSVGHLMLTKTRLIFAVSNEKIEVPLDAFTDANVKDGISRDHAQEIFMKMHAFRLDLKQS